MQSHVHLVQLKVTLFAYIVHVTWCESWLTLGANFSNARKLSHMAPMPKDTSFIIDLDTTIHTRRKPPGFEQFSLKRNESLKKWRFCMLFGRKMAKKQWISSKIADFCCKIKEMSVLSKFCYMDVWILFLMTNYV